MKPTHQLVLDRFIAACQTHPDIVAAFLGGSHARGEADDFSDLDLCVITTDAAFEAVVAQHDAFLRQLGQPIFMETFGQPEVVFFILADGTEGELNFALASHLDQIHPGPFTGLVDKHGLLATVRFSEDSIDPVAQREILRQHLYGFWHELSHFITAIGRGQLWWAAGQLEALRGQCVSLARLKHNFQADAGGQEPYFKVEQDVSEADLLPLLTTYGPRDRHSMTQAVHTLVHYYQHLAQPLAHTHNLTYPAELEAVMLEHLRQLEHAAPLQ